MSGRFGEIKVFSGTSHPQLTQDICTNLGIEPSKAEIFKFENDNTFVRILNNVREQDVFIVQPTDKPSNDNIMELLICMDAARRASAGRVTAVIPYFGYGRTDKKDQPRVPISARLIADLITTSGADRILTMDLHAPQIQGFFNIPVDELTATPILIEHFKKMKKSQLIPKGSQLFGRPCKQPIFLTWQPVRDLSLCLLPQMTLLPRCQLLTMMMMVKMTVMMVIIMLISDHDHDGNAVCP